MRANIPGRSPSRFARDLVTAGVTRCPCQRPPAPPSWTMPAGSGKVGKAAGNAPGPTDEVPPAIREPSASISLRPPLATSYSGSCSIAKSYPIAAPASTEGSDAGGVGNAPTTAGGPTPLPLTCVPPVTSAAGTAAGIPPPREDVAAAADVAAAPDEGMGGMPPPRGAADAVGVAAGIAPPSEDVAAADGSGAAPGEDAVDGHGHEEVIAPPPRLAPPPAKPGDSTRKCNVQSTSQCPPG